MKREILKAALAAMFMLGIFAPGWAQDRMHVMLVLDASGSMWQRVEDMDKPTLVAELMSLT